MKSAVICLCVIFPLICVAFSTIAALTLVMSGRPSLNFHQVPEHESDDKNEHTSFIPDPTPTLKPRTAKYTRLNPTFSPNSSRAHAYFHESVPSPVRAPPPPPPTWDDNPVYVGDNLATPINLAYQHHCDTVDVKLNPHA